MILFPYSVTVIYFLCLCLNISVFIDKQSDVMIQIFLYKCMFSDNIYG